MILRTFPCAVPGDGLPLSVHAEPRPRGVILVDVRRGEARLTGEALDGRGHECRFQLGFWEMVEPAPVAAFAGSKRINVLAEEVAAALIRDLESHGLGYTIPPAELSEVLSRGRMKDLATVIEVMSS